MNKIYADNAKTHYDQMILGCFYTNQREFEKGGDNFCTRLNVPFKSFLICLLDSPLYLDFIVSLTAFICLVLSHVSLHALESNQTIYIYITCCPLMGRKPIECKNITIQHFL